MERKYLVLLTIFGLLTQTIFIQANYDDDDDDDEDDGNDADNSFAIFERERRSDAPCSSPENLRKKQFFLQLEVERKELRGSNYIIYTEVLFWKKGSKGWPYVLSWNMKGKSGVDDGEFMERKGVITEYRMSYVNQSGIWNWLKNPKTGDTIFKNTATLNSPEKTTEVILKEPIKTLVMKLYPQQWEGVPFFEINAKYCPYVPPTRPTLPPPTKAPTPAPTPAQTPAPKPPKTPAPAVKAAPAKPKKEEDMEFDEFDIF